MQILKWFRFSITSILLVTFFLSNVVKADIDWILLNQNPDGSIAQSTDIATPYQSTSEALRTINAVEPTRDTNVALQFIAVDSYHSAENLSRKIIALNNASQETSSLVTELLGMQNFDGGWGELHGYDSSAIDTAFSLTTLSELNLTASPQVQAAIVYLLSKQQGDGGWHSGVNSSSIYETSLVISALSTYKQQYSGVSEAIVTATNYLLSQQGSSNLWASSFDSAHALLSLTESISDVSLLTSSISALEQSMLVNTSWDNDVYITSLVLRLLDTYKKRIANPVASVTTGGLVGDVTLAGSDEPISDVTVSVKEQSGLDVSTNSLGVFNIQSIKQGTYTLIFEKLGFSSASIVVNVINGKLTNIGNVALDILPTTGVLMGSIFDASSNSAISNAQLNLSGAQLISANSDQMGAFNLANLAVGNYSLDISAVGYNSVTVTFSVAAGQTLSLNQGLTLQGAFLDDTPADLFGYVLNGKTGQPVSSATVTLDSGQAVTTDASGKFNFISLARGSYRAVINVVGYKEAAYIINYTAGSNGNVGNLSIYPENATAQAPTTLTLIGSVIDGVNNAAIANASAKIVNTGEVIASDQDGKFTLSGITLQSFDIELSATGFQTKIYTITVNSFGEVAVEFVLPPFVAPDPLVTSSTISGTIVDIESGLPIANANIAIDGANTTTTNSLGQYTVSGINVLDMAFSITVVNYSPASINVNLSAHGSYTLDQSLTPIVNEVVDPVTNLPTKLFQVLNVQAELTSVNANTKARFTAEIANLNDAEQEGLILAEILDATGKSLATILSNIPGTSTQQANILFAGTETKTFEFDWDVKQSPVGTYQIIVRSVKPGSISRGNPTGTVLAESGNYINVLLTRLIDGATDFDPPLSQAGTTIPIKLDALIVNNGNSELMATDYTLSIIDPDTNNVVHTSQATLDTLKVLNNKTLSFGEWLPTITGNLAVSIIPNDSSIAGIIVGDLYVGDKATGTLTIDSEFVPEGSHTIRAKINLQGVDTKTGSSTDPLFFVVKNAVEKGGSYVGSNAVSWHQRNRCLGCHIQTQSYNGLASSLDKADVSVADTQFLFNALTTSQQSNGGIYLSHPSYGKTQTSLALWALKATPVKEDAFVTMYHATRYMYDRRIVSGNQTYWSQDHNTGYVNNASNITALVTMGMSDVIASSKKLDLTQFPDFTPSLLSTYEAELPRMVRFFLNRYSDNTSDNTIHALRLSALSEAKLAITDAALLQEINTAINVEETILRSRQRSDGGWGRYSTWSSDPLVSAMVGIALDYTNPSADDPMVRNNIQYLLNNQLSDGSWNNNNSFFGTRLASTSFVMAYMPKALDRLGGIDVDLTLDIPANISLVNPTVAEKTITPIVDGSQHFWSLTGVTSNEQVIEFDMTLHDMMLNEQRPVASSAFMEFNNSFNNDRIHVDLNIPSVTSTSELTLSASANKLTYTSNEDVLITPIVGNTSPISEEAVVDISIRAAGSTNVLATLAPINTGSIASGANITLSALWNTNGQFVGAYEVYVKLLDLQGRIVKEAIVPFSILSEGVAVNSTITTDKQIYKAWDDIELIGRIRNISANVIQSDTFIELMVKDPTGSTIHFTTFTQGELLPGTLRDVTSSLTLIDANSGVYAVDLTVKDNFTRNILATSATQFQVQRESVQSLVGTVTTNPSQVYQGDPTLCEDTLTNRSTTGLAGVTITRQIMNVATGLVLSESSVLKDLVAGETVSNLQSIDTDPLELGGYLCVLSATIDGQTAKVAAAGFDVLEPPIKLDASLKQTGKGKLLVLLGEESSCSSGSEHDSDSEHSSSDYEYSSSESEYSEPDSEHSDSDSHDCVPTVSPTQLYLENLLSDAGWSFTIVKSPSEFTTEMRTGAYSVYALLGNDIEIESSLEAELREAVYRGEGLLSANSESDHSDTDYSDAALGIDEQEQGKASGITLTSSLLLEAGTYLFDQRRIVRGVELEGAISDAKFNQLYCDCDDEEDNAVTHYNYGNGKSIYLGFDMLNQATLPNTGAPFGALLLNALNYIHPTAVSHDAGRIVPVTLQLQNLGIETPGRVIVSLDSTAFNNGARLVDSYSPNGNEVLIDGTGMTGAWLYGLAEDEAQQLDVWVKLPSTGATTLTTLTQTGIATEYEDYVSNVIQLPLNTVPNIDVIINDLQSLQYSSSQCGYAARYMSYARYALNNNNLSAALAYMLKSTYLLKELSNPQASAIRLKIDVLIRQVAAQL